jgi:hypothetical protein
VLTGHVSLFCAAQSSRIVLCSFPAVLCLALLWKRSASLTSPPAALSQLTNTWQVLQRHQYEAAVAFKATKGLARRAGAGQWKWEVRKREVQAHKGLVAACLSHSSHTC